MLIPILKFLDSIILKKKKDNIENSTRVLMRPIKKEYSRQFLLGTIKKLIIML